MEADSHDNTGTEPPIVGDVPTPSTPVDDAAMCPTPRRSSRTTRGVSSKYGEFYTGTQFENATNQQLDTVHYLAGGPFYDSCSDKIVGYQCSGLPSMNVSSPVQPVSVPVQWWEDTSRYGHLYAIPLPPAYQDNRAFWTGQGWVWQ